MDFMSVVFPEPLGPRMEKIPPSFMVRSMPFSTSFFPNFLYKSLTSIMVYGFHSWIIIHQIIGSKYWRNFFRKINYIYKQTSQKNYGFRSSIYYIGEKFYRPVRNIAYTVFIQIVTRIIAPKIVVEFIVVYSSVI